MSWEEMERRKENGQDPPLTKLINQNTTIPTKKSQMFSTVVDGQL